MKDRLVPAPFSVICWEEQWRVIVDPTAPMGYTKLDPTASMGYTKLDPTAHMGYTKAAARK